MAATLLRRRMPQSDRLLEVLGEPDGVLAGWSGNKIVMRVVARAGREMSHATALKIKGGEWGEAEFLRYVAQGFASELLARHGDEIEELTGMRTEEAAEEWLLYIADPRLSHFRRMGETPAPASEPSLQEMLTRAAEEGARRALEAAGIRPLESPADYFWRRMRELKLAYKKKDVTLSLEGGSDNLTFAEAEAQLQAIEELWKTDPKD